MINGPKADAVSIADWEFPVGLKHGAASRPTF